MLWRNMGPYHVARTRAAHKRFADEGMDLVVVELAGSEVSRAWSRDREGLPFDVRTLSPETELDRHSPALTNELLRVLKELEPEGIAAAGYDRPEMRAALRWCKAHGAASVLMSETKANDRRRSWIRRQIISYWVRQAGAALVSGTTSRAYLCHMGCDPGHVFMPYGVVDNAYIAARVKEAANLAAPGGLRSGRFFLTCCRLLERRKNLTGLLDAYKTYRTETRGEPWDLVVCGEGPDRGLLETYVRDEQVQGVHLEGHRQLDELVSYYAHAGCLVHPAAREAWGLVVNEAMAAGLPVLVSRLCGCCIDLVDHGGNGFIFDPHDAGGLAALMARMSGTDKIERAVMGERGRVRIRNWTPERFADSLWNAYKVAQAQVSVRER
jgi:glycosyltransferase involved in cell wall biosynthesis